MNETKVSLTRQALKSPRAAAIAGILFAVLYGVCLVLNRISIPADPTADSAAWLETNIRLGSLALNLVPFAGIAFLWFIGVIRDCHFLHTEVANKFFWLGKNITIETEPDQPVWTDGEYYGRTPINPVVEQGKLPVVVSSEGEG